MMMKNFRKYAIGLVTVTSAVAMTTMPAWAAEKKGLVALQKASVTVESVEGKQADIVVDGKAGMETQAASLIMATYAEDSELGQEAAQFEVVMQQDGKYAFIDQKTGEAIAITLKADGKDPLNAIVITEADQGMMKK